MLAALSSQAAGGARQAVGGTLACLAAGLQRRGFAAAAKGDSDTVTVEINPFKTHRIDPPPTTVTATKDELLSYFRRTWRAGAAPVLPCSLLTGRMLGGILRGSLPTPLPADDSELQSCTRCAAWRSRPTCCTSPRPSAASATCERGAGPTSCGPAIRRPHLLLLCSNWLLKLRWLVLAVRSAVRTQLAAGACLKKLYTTALHIPPSLHTHIGTTARRQSSWGWKRRWRRATA
jgi:hypothetical protein